MDADLILIPALILVGIGMIWVLYNLVNEKSVLGAIIFFLLGGLVSATLGSLASTGLVDSEWIFVGLNAWCGIGLMLPYLASLYSPPPPKAPGWTPWAQLLMAAFLVVSAIERNWYHYWH